MGKQGRERNFSSPSASLGLNTDFNTNPNTIPNTDENLGSFESIYQFALTLIARRTYNSATLEKKILSKLIKESVDFDRETVTQVLQELCKKKFLDDSALCKEVASVWVQKKPISRTRLHQKLLAYQFVSQDIHEAMMYVEQLYVQKEFTFIGGIPLSRLHGMHANTIHLSLWSTLAFAAVLLMMDRGETLSRKKIINRLTIRGFGVDVLLLEIIKTLFLD